MTTTHLRYGNKTEHSFQDEGSVDLLSSVHNRESTDGTTRVNACEQATGIQSSLDRVGDINSFEQSFGMSDVTSQNSVSASQTSVENTTSASQSTLVAANHNMNFYS